MTKTPNYFSKPTTDSAMQDISLESFKAGAVTQPTQIEEIDHLTEVTGFSGPAASRRRGRPPKNSGPKGRVQGISMQLSEATYDKLRNFCAERHDISYRVAMEILIEEYEKSSGRTL